MLLQNQQIIDNINNNDELINNDLMFGNTNQKLIQFACQNYENYIHHYLFESLITVQDVD